MQQMFAQESSFERWQNDTLRCVLTRRPLPPITKVFMDSGSAIWSNVWTMFFLLLVLGFVLGVLVFSVCNAYIPDQGLAFLATVGFESFVAFVIECIVYMVTDRDLRRRKKRHFCAVGNEGFFVFTGTEDMQTFEFRSIVGMRLMPHLDTKSTQPEKLVLYYDNGEEDFIPPNHINVDLQYIYEFFTALKGNTPKGGNSFLVD